MTKHVAGQWALKLLRLTLVFLLIAGTVDLLVVTLRSLIDRVSWTSRPAGEVLREPVSEHLIKLPDTGSPGDSVPYRDLKDAGSLADKKLLLHIRPDGLTARYEISLNRNHPLLELIQSGLPAGDMSGFIKETMGEILVLGQSLEFEPAQVIVLPNEPLARVVTDSRKFDPASQDYQIFLRSPRVLLPIEATGTEVVFETEQAAVWSRTELLASKTAERTVFVLPPDRGDFSCGITMSQWTPREKIAAKPLADLINRGFTLPVAGNLIIGLLEALPFLLLLFWAKRHQFKQDQPDFAWSERIVGIYLVYHFLYFGFLAFNNLIGEWRNPALYLLNLVQSRWPSPVYAHPRESFILIVMMATFLYLWPAYSARQLRPREGPEPTSSRWRGMAAGSMLGLLLIVMGGAVPFFLARNYPAMRSATWSLGGFYEIALSSLLLLLLLSCLWLAGEFFDRRRPAATMAFFFLLVYLVASQDNQWLFNHSTTRAMVHLVNFILVTPAMTAAFGGLIYAAVTGKSLHREWRQWSGARKTIAVSVILGVAFSTRSWTAPMVQWPIWSLAWQLKSLFYLALIALLAGFLRDVASNRSPLTLPASARIAGILLALSLFYSPAARWHYIPICFIVGYALLSKWLLPVKRLDWSIFTGIEGKLPAVIRQIIRFNEAERIHKMLKKELPAKVAKGELSYEGYTEKLEAQQAAIAGIKQDLTIKGHFAKEIVLGFGPTSSAWENGKRASLHSLVFAMPWIFLYLRNMAFAPAPPDSYLILELLNSLASLVVTWVSYGFIFGYFYPSMTGKNGIQKGLALWLTIIGPNMAWTALINTLDGSNWKSFGFWTLQIFIHCMLLGLVAGDYEILRKAGYKFSDLLEIHKLSSLSAWASSILVAISAAVAALLTSGAVEVVSSVLKYAGLIPSEIKLPMK